MSKLEQIIKLADSASELLCKETLTMDEVDALHHIGAMLQKYAGTLAEVNFSKLALGEEDD